jgi:hypothetical protein
VDHLTSRRNITQESQSHATGVILGMRAVGSAERPRFVVGAKGLVPELFGAQKAVAGYRGISLAS